MQDNAFYRDDPIVVMGRPYSGTTMTMKILEMLGVTIFFDKNVTGFAYKHRESRRVDVLELENVRKGLIRGKNRLEVISEVKKELPKIFTPTNGLWGFKGLPLGHNLDIWLEAFPKMKIIYIYRNSVSRHLVIHPERWKNMQDQYQAIFQNYICSYPNTEFLKIVYEEVLLYPKEHFQKIADFVGVNLSEELKDYSIEFTKQRD